MEIIHFMIFFILAVTATASTLPRLEETKQIESKIDLKQSENLLSNEKVSYLNRRSLGLNFPVGLKSFSTLLPCRQPYRRRNLRHRQHHHRDHHRSRPHHTQHHHHHHHHRHHQSSISSTTLSTPTNTPNSTQITTTTGIVSTSTKLELLTSSSTPRYNDPDNELIYDIDVRFGGKENK